MAANVFGRLLKPLRLTTALKLGNNNHYLYPTLTAPRASAFNQQAFSSRVMTTSTANYHYHEKPPAHKHDKLWKAERYLSLALLGVLPAAWVIPHPLMDYAVATSLVVHVHWGLEAIVVDYIRPSIFGPVLPKVSVALLYVLSILAAGGLFIFNWTDVGTTQAIRMLAKI